jgi:ATP adenylyltransferase
MAHSKILIPPNTLWESVKHRTQTALRCGALQSIPTEFEFVEQDGVNFLVRVLVNLDQKKAAQEKQDQQFIDTGKEFNPFLPYEEDLFVADITDTHVCILNKFNVVEHHLLIITRAFAEQESLLTVEDFTAMWACLTDFPGLVFYNSGKAAGASQRHKHLQIIPLPLTNTIEIPIARLFPSTKLQQGIKNILRLPFLHAFTSLDYREDAQVTFAKYRCLLQAVGIEATTNNMQSGAYNLLATKEWMLIVPRSHEDYQSISVNSLGFAGAMLVRNSTQMQLLKDIGPMNILRNVGFPI